MTPTTLAWTSSKSTTSDWPRSTESRTSPPSPTSGRRSRSSTRVSAHLPANQLYCPLSNALFANSSLSQLSVRGIWCERASLRCTRALKLGPCPRVQEACFTRQPTFDNKELSQTRIWLNAKTTVCGFAFFIAKYFDFHKVTGRKIAFVSFYGLQWRPIFCLACWLKNSLGFFTTPKINLGVIIQIANFWGILYQIWH